MHFLEYKIVKMIISRQIAVLIWYKKSIRKIILFICKFNHVLLTCKVINKNYWIETKWNLKSNHTGKQVKCKRIFFSFLTNFQHELPEKSIRNKNTHMNYIQLHKHLKWERDREIDRERETELKKVYINLKFYAVNEFI